MAYPASLLSSTIASMRIAPCSRSRCSDDFNSLMNRGVAAEDRGPEPRFPVTSRRRTRAPVHHSGDSLVNASSALKGAALDFLVGGSSWASIATLPGIGLGFGAFTVGWEIGSGVADVLGIEYGPATQGNPGLPMRSTRSRLGPISSRGGEAVLTRVTQPGAVTITRRLRLTDSWFCFTPTVTTAFSRFQNVARSLATCRPAVCLPMPCLRFSPKEKVNAPTARL